MLPKRESIPKVVIEGGYSRGILKAMKTTVDIPEAALKDAMRFAKAKTKREAILAAVEEYNRRKGVEQFLKEAGGAFPDFPGLEEIRGDDSERDELLEKLWGRKK